MMTSQSQLLLGIKLPDDATFDNYVGESEVPGILVRQLHHKDPHLWYVYLWGSRGAGCSHLLQGACHQGRAMGMSCVYIALTDPQLPGVGILEGLAQLDLVCIDGLECICTDRVWEEGLFHFFNQAKDMGTRLVLAAHSPPSSLSLRLADLQSRLASGLIYQVKPLTDEQKVRALQLRANNRGMHLDNDLARFIVTRSPRDIGTLFWSLDKLDQASLHEKRRLTTSFVKQVLGL
jgi:DnaA family protein